jgi:hypothetical protein
MPAAADIRKGLRVGSLNPLRAAGYTVIIASARMPTTSALSSMKSSGLTVACRPSTICDAVVIAFRKVLPATAPTCSSRFAAAAAGTEG